METNNNEKQETQQPCLTDLIKLHCSLTTALVKEWFDSIELPCSEGMSSISFRLDDENYTLHTDILPIITIVKRYNLEPEDAPILAKAMNAVDQAGRLVKASLENDDDGNPESLLFHVSWVEGSVDHFKLVLREYVEILNNAVSSSQYYYQKFSNEEKNSKTAELYPTLENN